MDLLEVLPRRQAAGTAPSLLVVPGNGAAVDAAYATFEWQPVDHADGYRFEVAEDVAFTRIVVDAAVGAATSLTLFEAFPADGRQRFARVKALDGARTTVTSATIGFRPVTDAQLEHERMPAKPVARRAPVTLAPAPPHVKRAVDTDAVIEPWREARTTRMDVIASMGLILLMIAIFAAIMAA